jgi:hypothetical protein
VADGVDAAVERDEQAAREPPVDHPRRDAQRQQLPTRHHAVLALRERGHVPITAALTTHAVVRGAVL